MATARAFALPAAALRDLKRLVQLDDEGSRTARNLASSICFNMNEWRDLPTFAPPDLQQLLDAQVRRCATGKRFWLSRLCLPRRWQPAHFSVRVPCMHLSCRCCSSSFPCAAG